MKTKCPLPKRFSGTRRVSGTLLGLLVLLLSTASAAGAAPFAFISHATSTGAGRVSVIDADPSAVCSVVGQTPPCVVTTLQVGASPGGVAVNPAGTFAYVANWDGTVSVIRIADIPDNISSTTVIPISNVGPRPWGVAVSSDNAKVYVGLDDGSVAEIDANTLGVTNIRDRCHGGSGGRDRWHHTQCQKKHRPQLSL
jgi:hypothetical protein